MTSVNVLIRRGWAHTVIGVLILVVMLFPLYWMLNVSLQSAGSERREQQADRDASRETTRLVSRLPPWSRIAVA